MEKKSNAWTEQMRKNEIWEHKHLQNQAIFDITSIIYKIPKEGDIYFFIPCNNPKGSRPPIVC